MGLRKTASEGRLVVLEHTSKVLQGNPWSDPHVRKLHVWLPPQYDQGGRSRGRSFPVLYDLVGYTGSGPSHTNWRNFSENVPERAARLIRDGRMGPCIIVFPDCFTALGGNQYVNSSALGAYADYLTMELIGFVDGEFRTLASRDHRGCFGKSSGGYGAMLQGMKYAKHWGAIANHSGDAYFDFVYRPDWPNTLTELSKHRRRQRVAGPINVAREEQRAGEGLDDGRVRRFLQSVWPKDNPTSAEVHCLMNLCMAATYDPDPKAPNGFRLPFNLETGEIISARWRRWLAQDPINLVKRHREALLSLKGIYIDCGWRDQFQIHYGSRILSKRMRASGIPHRYEEFDGTHSGIDSRMDESLPFLYKALKP
jgi:S-formylglutathione hydrolase FrmB